MTVQCKKLSILTAVIVAVAFATTARASTIYAIDSAGVYSIDVDSGATTLLDTFGGLYNASRGPTSNTLYLTNVVGDLLPYVIGSSTVTNLGGAVPGNSMGYDGAGLVYSGSGQTLYSTTSIGVVTSTIGNGANFYAGDLAFSPTTGTLYGATYNSTSNQLVTVNPATGAHTLVNTLSFPGFGLAFSNDGRLWCSSSIGDLYELNPTTGVATYAHTLPFIPYDLATETVVPEPASMSLLALGAMALGRRKRKP